MAYYHKLGNLPSKRHIQFRQPDGSLYFEELVSSKGFSGIYSNLYHINAPTRIKDLGPVQSYGPKAINDYPLKNVHLKTSEVQSTGEDFLEARKPLLMNADVVISICNPSEKTMDYHYKNGEADEVIFVHEGNGTLLSQFGKLNIKKGDYVVIPRTTIFRIEWDDQPVRLQITEATYPIETVKRYRNDLGQLLEHSPYCERDIRPPEELMIEEEKGEYLVKIKKKRTSVSLFI